MIHSKKLFIFACCLCTLVSVSRGQIISSKHNLSVTGTGSYQSGDQVCIFCHTPHQTSGANSQTPLWNHSLSANATYGIYTSSTMDSIPEEIGLASPGSASISQLCLGCHDGTIGLGNLFNLPNSGGPLDTTTMITGFANLGTDLSNDHPVHLLWDHQTEKQSCSGCHGQQGPPGEPTSVLPFFDGYIECSTCHDVHNGYGYEPMLRKPAAGSEICLHCHEK